MEKTSKIRSIKWTILTCKASKKNKNTKNIRMHWSNSGQNTPNNTAKVNNQDIYLTSKIIKIIYK